MIAVHLYLPGKFPVLTTVKFHNVRIIHWRKTTICISSVPSLNMIILSFWTLKRLKTGRCNLTKLAPFSLSGQFGVAKHPVSVHVCGTNKQGPFNHTGIKHRKTVPDSKVHVAHMGPLRSCRPQVGPMLAPWTLLSGVCMSMDIQYISTLLDSIPAYPYTPPCSVFTIP